jgi:hypothetical protein
MSSLTFVVAVFGAYLGTRAFSMGAPYFVQGVNVMAGT